MDSKKKAIAGLLVVAFAVVAMFLLLGNGEKFFSQIPVDAEIEARTVRGQSLEPLIPEGAEIKLALDPEHKLSIAAGDVVVFRVGSSDAMKVVYGVPGDRFALQKTAGGTAWNILVNNTVAKNSEGKPYTVGDNGYKVLSLYVDGFKSVIPDGAYLLLGDNPAGSHDSTAFGLVDRSDFLGKVVDY